jgi:hypothetical protein
MKLAAVRLFRIRKSRGRLLGSPDKLPAIDGPVAKSSTRHCVNWLAAHESACFLADRGEALGVSQVMLGLSVQTT